MIKRLLANTVEQRLGDYPVVALLGPRQSGKTTLAKSFGGRYFDLEKDEDRLRLDIDWPNITATSELVVLDEAQEMPGVFPRLRSAIDEDRKRNGRFLLLGSVSPALMSRVSESLAGRLALCELTPFTAKERPRRQWDNLWHRGGYPDGGILEKSRYPHWQQFYLQTLAQRDFPHWGLPSKPGVTQRLFRMLAALHGQPWNASRVGKSLGLSYHTVNNYVEFLEQAYLIRRLPSYSANIKKRLVKSPKVYWRDTGLLHALLGFDASDDILAQPWVGASWEGWIIEQLLNNLTAAGQPFEAYYARTSDQYEVDLLLRCRGKLWAIEVKLTSSPTSSDLRRLKTIAERVGAGYCVIISRTASPVQGIDDASLNLQAALELFLG